ncbi:MAG: DUF86 domain-containing protein [Methanoregulaceae archaeon]
MRRSRLLFLNDIAESIESIRTYVGNRSFEEFSADRMRLDAVVRNFEIIGEAVKNLDEELKSQFPSTDWKGVAGFRDTLIHGYFGIDKEILWDIITRKIPALEQEIRIIIEFEKKRE